ncbi:MAG: SpoIIE family protein phosphatase [Cyclobacteriaceae bacterium]
MSNTVKIRLVFLVGLLSWVLYSVFDIYNLILHKYEMREAYVNLLPQAFLSFFILSTLFYYRYIVTKAESINFLDLLWKVFITGLITTIVSLGIRLLFNVFADTAFIKNAVTVNVLYHINVGLVTVYAISTFVVWKRLILYQKSKKLIQVWNFFEYAMIFSLAFDFVGFSWDQTPFRIALVFLTTFTLILSFNLKWIAYLNFKQKWKSILFILLSGIYLYHFYINLGIYSSTGVLSFDLLDRVFIIAILIFIFIYAVIAVLVTLFNLPTSSEFEKKLREAVDFQKLSQTVPSGQSESETYEILIDSSMSAVFADAAWIESLDKEAGRTRLLTRSISKKQVRELKSGIRDEDISNIINMTRKDVFAKSKTFTSLAKGEFRSIFALPIYVKNEQIGALVLLQEVSDAFNREMVNIITTFVNQASLTLENARLLDDAIENERYKEQLKIAKLVQNSLLPADLGKSDHFDIAAYSMAADEVGGDYYDLIDHKNGRYSLIIADVSGKGTSAAFNMAQMKGIFHSLASLNLSTSEFMIQVNRALSECLERSSFITASYYLIDTTRQTIKFVRAGHCPTLVYTNKEEKAEFLQTKGMGLGILRNSDYNKYVESNTIIYSQGDVVLLHTDGITEATDRNNSQYGDQRLQTALNKHAKLPPVDIKEAIIDDLYAFLNGEKLDDDYTLVILKFT